MRLRIDHDGTLTVIAPDVFTDFAITGARPASEQQREALRARGVYSGEDDDHVFIERETIEELAEAEGVGRDWIASFDSMVTYATTKGWVDGAGRIRAHWADDDPSAEEDR